MGVGVGVGADECWIPYRKRIIGIRACSSGEGEGEGGGEGLVEGGGEEREGEGGGEGEGEGEEEEEEEGSKSTMGAPTLTVAPLTTCKAAMTPLCG